MSFSLDDHRDSLNDLQYEAVSYRGGPLLVQAGPGTGKTRVLSYRIAALAAANGEPTVLAITFTNKAASEIAERVEMLAGSAVSDGRIQVGTFHSWALGFLKHYYGEQVREVVDEADARAILSAALKQAGIRGDVRRIHRMISRAKQEWPVRAPDGEPDFRQYLFVYAKAMGDYGLWDFDDLILESAKLLESPEIAYSFRENISAVLVDEFQDVSPAQYALLRLMLPSDGNVTVIGDANQAIYGFRGASPQFMQAFAADFHDVRIVTLGEVYRCPQSYLDAARAVIGQEGSPRLTSCRGTGSEIIFKPHRDSVSEARWIALEIEKNVGGLSFDSMNARRAGGDDMRSLSDVAVLFRTRRIGEVVAKALFEEGIPYQLSAPPDPLEQPEIRNIWRLWEAVKGKAMEYHASRLPGKKEKWLRKLNALMPEVSRYSSVQLIRVFAQWLDIDPELPEVAGLMDAVERNPYIDSLGVLLREEVDIIRSKTESVSLLTLHAAKGLEFPVVFIAGCDDGVIPWKGSQLDEEARLFYVGLTRASERLYISYPRKRRVNGSYRPRKPSRFIKKIPQGLCITPVIKKNVPKRTMKQRQKTLF